MDYSEEVLFFSRHIIRELRPSFYCGFLINVILSPQPATKLKQT